MEKEPREGRIRKRDKLREREGEGEGSSLRWPHQTLVTGKTTHDDKFVMLLCGCMHVLELFPVIIVLQVRRSVPSGHTSRRENRGILVCSNPRGWAVGIGGQGGGRAGREGGEGGTMPVPPTFRETLVIKSRKTSRFVTVEVVSFRKPSSLDSFFVILSPQQMVFSS